MTRQPEQPTTHGRPRASLLDVGMSRRQFLAAAGAGGALLLLPGLPETASAARRVGSTRPGDSIVVSWNEAFLEGVRGSKLGPPMVARALAIGHTCTYDAWAAYDRKAAGTASAGRCAVHPPNARSGISGRRSALPPTGPPPTCPGQHLVRLRSPDADPRLRSR
jgi:hypothetical protein